MSQLFPSGDQNIGASALASVLPMNSVDFREDLLEKTQMLGKIEGRRRG